MRKVFQKSLAFMVSTALCLTAFVGCLTANADAPSVDGTIAATTANASVTVGSTFTVDVDVASTTSGIEAAAALFTVGFDDSIVTLTGIASKSTSRTVEVEGETASRPYYELETDKEVENVTDSITALLLVDDLNAPQDSMGVTLTFTATAVGDAAIAISDYTAASDKSLSLENTIVDEEVLVNLIATQVDVEVVAAAPEHTCTPSETWSSDATNHWKVCSDPDCGEIIADTVAAHTFGEPVITQPTVDTAGSKVYTCTGCGYEKTVTIAVPTAITTVNIANDLEILEKVAMRFRVSKTTLNNNGYNDFDMVINYSAYKVSEVAAENFKRENYEIVKTFADDYSQLSGAVYKLTIAPQAMYEMNLPIKATVYFKDADGIRVAYREILNSTMSSLILSNMSKWDAATKTQMVDLANYATALQNYFAYGDLATATRINSEFTAYADLGSTNTEFDYNATYARDTVDGVTIAPDFSPSASNDIRFRVRIDPSKYDMSKIRLFVTYNDGFNGAVKGVSKANGDDGIIVTELSDISGGAAIPIRAYFFKDLSLYDFNKTVTATIEYDGDVIYTETYCLEHYAYNRLDSNGTNYIASETDTMRVLLTTAMRFANSTRATIAG